VRQAATAYVHISLRCSLGWQGGNPAAGTRAGLCLPLHVLPLAARLRRASLGIRLVQPRALEIDPRDTLIGLYRKPQLRALGSFEALASALWDLTGTASACILASIRLTRTYYSE
jgi:hypothetical protein